MHAAIARCFVAALQLYLRAGDPGDQSCGSDAPLLLEAALLADIGEERQMDPKAACVVVALRESPTTLLDPPHSVVFSLKRRAKLRVVPFSESARCPDGPVLWASQPKCSPSGNARLPTASVETARAHVWCSRGFRKQDGRWVPYPFPGTCE